MKLTVLFREDGRIVSLSRVATRTQPDENGVPPLRSSVAPGKGERVATIDLDPEWHHRPLSELHRHLIVDHSSGAAQLKARATKD